MPRHRNALPQLGGELFLTDGGLETTLIFHEGLNLPEFAAFDLLKDASGRESLQYYFEAYVALARKYEVGYSASQIADANRRAVDMLCAIPV